jgi:PAS domain S-box-containing protein
VVGVITMAGDALLMVVDGNGVVVKWSRRAQKLLGYTADEVVGQPVVHLVTRVTAGHRGTGRTGRDDLPGADGHAVADLRVQPTVGRDGTVGWKVFQAAPGGATVPDAEAAAAQTWLAHAPAGLYVLDTELRIVSARLATQTMSGMPADRVLGRRLTEVYSFPAPDQIEAMLREVVDSGVPAPERVVRTHLREAPGGARWTKVSAFRLEDQRGVVLGVAAVLADVSELEKSGVRMHLLRELHLIQIGQTLDVVATCQELADVLVQDFADVAAVDVVDSVVRGEDPPLAPLGREVPLRRAGFRHSGGGRQVQEHRVGAMHRLPFPGPYAQVLTDLKPRVVDLGSDVPWLTADPARAEAIRASGVRTLFAAPLELRGAVFGLLSLYRMKQSGPFDGEEADFAIGLADLAAVLIDRARLYTREHTIAAAVQRRLLPARPCSQTGLETAHVQVFGEAGGGGGFDSFTLAGARTALVVGEVSGQGIQAAATMGQLRTVIRSLARLDLEPDEMLARVNDATMLLAAERAALPPSDPSRREPLTASGVYAIYDPIAQTCTFARAHHPAPVIVSPDGTAVEVPDAQPGTLLGTAEGLPFTSATVKLPAGSILAFYTPSILPAAPSGAPGDEGPLRRILTGTQRPLQDLCDDVVYSLRDGPRPGDAVLVLLRTRTFPPGQTATWQFGPDPEEARRARAHTRSKLAAWNIDEDTAQAAELVISELVTNAIRYGTPPMWLRIIKDLSISVEVHDGSPVAPRLRHPGTLDEFGRGLGIVGRLVEAWSTRYTPEGKIVWAELGSPAR